ncbi:MAG: pilus assembly protein PilP [Deltaproteobacteria bacterium]|nr:pilus assembly protein PilP [Deltaproteobacteria bacterium]
MCVGCQQGAPPQPPAAEVKKEAPKPETVPIAGEAKKEEKAPPKADEVNPQRNPFKTFIVKATERPSVVAPKTPLQRYELEQLKLVAIMWGINSPAAMVETPDGKGYSIKKGYLIGNREGRVKRIEKDRVIVEERFTEARGEVVTNEFEIKLPLPKGEEELR